jgi:hypothetical protein
MKNRGITVILLILCLTAVLASPAMAAQKPVTKIGACANYGGTYINVTAPHDINLGVMTVGGFTTGHSSVDGSVSTDASTYQVVATDQKVLLAGYMNTVPDGSGTKLTDKLQIGSSPGSLDAADSPGITYTDTTDLPFYVSQHVEPGDVPGYYSITITFVGTYQ